MRLLLITYYFPPCGGAAVQRWLKWLPDLVQKGFEVTVLTTKDGDYPVTDASLLEEIPAQVKVLRVPAPSSGKLWKLLTGNKNAIPYGDLSSSGKQGMLNRLLIWGRLNLIIPDMRKFWNPKAYWVAVDFLRENPIDIVITTGPPHSTHLIGQKLKEQHKVTWVADWRDPWSSIYYLKLNPPSALSMRRHRYLERKVALSADLNIVISEHLALQLPGTNKQMIYNGFDARKFSSAQFRNTADPQDTVFRLKYVGNLTEGQRLDSLLEIIGDALQGKDFELTFVGTKLSPQHKEMLEILLPGKYRVIGFVSHREALREMAAAHLLLLLINYYEGSEGMLTTKLFEYIATQNSILCVGPHGGEAEKIISDNAAGACFDVSESAAAVQYLRSFHANWEAGKDIRNNKDISSLSSQNQALRLIQALEGIKKD